MSGEPYDLEYARAEAAEEDVRRLMTKIAAPASRKSCEVSPHE